MNPTHGLDDPLSIRTFTPRRLNPGDRITWHVCSPAPMECGERAGAVIGPDGEEPGVYLAEDEHGVQYHGVAYRVNGRYECGSEAAPKRQ